MKTFRDEWVHYRDTVYKDHLPLQPDQEKQLHAAWFGAGIAMVGIMDEIAQMPTAKAVLALEAIRKEIGNTALAIARSGPPNSIKNN